MAEAIITRRGVSVELTGDAVVADVLATKTFYKDDPKTKLTGTMTNKVGSTTVITPSTADQTIEQGYYGGAAGDGKVLGDADLVAGNIKNGVNIFSVTGIAGLGPGTRLHISSDTTVETQNTSMTKKREMLINTAGTYRVKFSIRATDESYAASGRIYKNGNAFGTMQSTVSLSYVEFSEDLFFNVDDTCQMYIAVANASHYCVANNFRLYDDLVIATVVL